MIFVQFPFWNLLMSSNSLTLCCNEGRFCTILLGASLKSVTCPIGLLQVQSCVLDCANQYIDGLVVIFYHIISFLNCTKKTIIDVDVAHDNVWNEAHILARLNHSNLSNSFNSSTVADKSVNFEKHVLFHEKWSLGKSKKVSLSILSYI